jgi:hypothetical protein
MSSSVMPTTRIRGSGGAGVASRTIESKATNSNGCKIPACRTPITIPATKKLTNKTEEIGTADFASRENFLALGIKENII